MRVLQLRDRRPHTHMQKGAGIGSIFSKLLTYARPIVRTALKAAAPQAKRTLKSLAKTGLSVAGNSVADAIGGDISLKQAIAKNARQGASDAKRTVKQGTKRMLRDAGDGVLKDIKRRRVTKRGKKLTGKGGRRRVKKRGKQKGKGKRRQAGKGTRRRKRKGGKKTKRKTATGKRNRRRSRGIFL